MRNIWTLLFVAILSVINVSGQNKGTFDNPVIKGDMADPTVISVGDTYYATGTSSEWAPHYPLFESKDLINWRQIGHIFDQKPEWTVNSFWAPELYYHNNKVYCYYTARRASDGISYIGVATADSPTGKFTDHGVIIEHGLEAIDAFVYNDNGQLYISWKAYGLEKRPIEIVASKLSDDGLHLEGEPFTLLVDDGNIGMEGQYHFKSGDYYYIVYAARGCCGPGSDYNVNVARSKDFRGPYEKYADNPILHAGEGEYLSCGHGTVATTPDGRMFYLCHAYLKGEGFFTGRQPILQEMYVSDDNWVQFKTGKVALREQPLPFSHTVQHKAMGFEDRFAKPKLKVDWTWNYPYAEINAEIKKGKLLLSGTPKKNNLLGTALCVRSQAPYYSYETRVTNKNSSTKGLTMYGDDKNLVVLGLENDRLVLKFVKDGQETIVFNEKAVVSAYLKIEVTRGSMLSFYYSKNGKSWTKINEEPFDGAFLTRWDRVARPGLIHIGKLDEPAEFSFFKLDNK